MDAKPTRSQVSKRLRFEIFRRDNFTCRYCGLHAGEDAAELTVDHVVPYTLGGTNDPANLVTCCKDCNAGKSSIAPGSPLVDDVAQDALRWGRAMTLAAESLHASRASRDDYRQVFVDRWRHFTIEVFDKDAKTWVRQPIELPPQWTSTVDRFMIAGLPVDEMADAVSIAMDAHGVSHDNLLRYFAGVCWRKVQEMHDAARALLEAGEVE